MTTSLAGVTGAASGIGFALTPKRVARAIESLANIFGDLP
jgi:hypothetical protein